MNIVKKSKLRGNYLQVVRISKITLTLNNTLRLNVFMSIEYNIIL